MRYHANCVNSMPNQTKMPAKKTTSATAAMNTVTPAIVTGKPISLGGSYGREAATGRGCVYMFREAAPSLGLSPADTKFVVQGYGNVGSVAARLLAREGCRVVAIGDRTFLWRKK